MTKRVLWEVLPNARMLGIAGWRVRYKVPGEEWMWTQRRYPTRKLAIAKAAATAKYNWEWHQELGELQVRNLLGFYSKDKRTYGKDPDGEG